MTTNRILCATDFSESSRQALQWAVTLAQQLEAHLTILHAYRLTKLQNGEAVTMKKKMEAEAHHNFSVLEKEVLQGKNVTYDFKTEIGFIADRVEEHAKNNAIKLLVMDKNMSAGNKETFDELIEHIKIPLVIVP